MINAKFPAGPARGITILILLGVFRLDKLGDRKLYFRSGSLRGKGVLL